MCFIWGIIKIWPCFKTHKFWCRWNFNFQECKKWCYNAIEGKICPLHGKGTLCCTLYKFNNTNIVKTTSKQCYNQSTPIILYLLSDTWINVSLKVFWSKRLWRFSQHETCYISNVLSCKTNFDRIQNNYDLNVWWTSIQWHN